MPKARFTSRAKADLRGIASYTVNTWGELQAARYLAGIEACCERLANNPLSGRACGEAARGLRRAEHGKHVVFYRPVRAGIVVSRVLHQNMLPKLHGLNREN